jgi:hypothetical protein
LHFHFVNLLCYNHGLFCASFSPPSWEQNPQHDRPFSSPFKIVLAFHYSTDRGVTFLLEIRYIGIKERSCTMFVFAAAVVVLLLALAGSDLFVAQYSPDELSSMGVQEQ